jgi:hypothetical protein
MGFTIYVARYKIDQKDKFKLKQNIGRFFLLRSTHTSLEKFISSKAFY